MTQAHTDNHIICLFEDIQFHLEKMGVHSTLREARLIFCYNDEDTEWSFNKWDGLAYYLPTHSTKVYKLYHGPKAIRDIAQFLWEFSKHYLDTPSRVPDHEE